MYLSYDNDSNNWVYFDDMKVSHAKSNVLQYNEYYPFGMQSSTSWTRESNANNFLYNSGSEFNQGSGWYETFFRGYDPTLGRFHQVDPMAYASGSQSPYNYAFNDPVFFNDPNGDYPQPVLHPENGGDWDNVFAWLGAGSGGFDYVVSQYFGSGWIGIMNSFWGPDMFQDANAVRNGQMSPDEYAAKYGTKYDGSLGGLLSVMTDLNSVKQSAGLYTFEFMGKVYGGVYHTENGVVVSAYSSELYESLDGAWIAKGTAQLLIFGGSNNRGNSYYNPSEWELLLAIIEPAVNEGAKDALMLKTFTKGATSVARGLGAFMTALNTGLTGYTIAQEYNNGKINTHSFVNGTVAFATVGAAAATFFIGTATAPIWLTAVGIGGTAYGIMYGIDHLSGGRIGIDQGIDKISNNWGEQFNK